MSDLDLERELAQQDAPPRALQGIIDEVRSSGPDVDWERLEARLFDESGDVRAPVVGLAPPKKSNRNVAIGVGLALAAAFAFAIVSPSRTMEESKSTPVAARAPLVGADGHTIVAGEKIVAGNGTWIRGANRIAVRLEPGTVATVLDVGERVHLALETGAVSADVVPVAGGEPFAVDLSGKRVAVHGTRLRVALLADAVEVAVSEGSAVVGAPRGAGRTEGTIVAAGSIGRFGADAHVTPNKELATHLVEDALAEKKPVAPPTTTATTIAGTSEPTHPAVPPTHPAIALKPASTTAASPTTTTPEPPQPPPGLSADQLSAPFAKLDSALHKCARKCPANVVCQYEQTLTVSVDPTGRASLVSADPGLDSGDRACWSGVLSTIDFPAAAGPTTAKHHVVLGGHTP